MTAAEHAPWGEWLAWLRRGLTPVSVLCLALGLWGCLAVYNATFCLASPYLYVGRQVAWLVLGFGALVVAAAVPSRYYQRLLPAAFCVAYLPMGFVLVCGIRVNGTRGWFSWHGLFVQPAELAKPVFVLSLAYILSRTVAERGRWRTGYLPVLAVFGVWLVPVLLQPDFGMALIYGLTFVIVYACLGGRLWHVATTALAGLPFLALAVRARPHLYERFIGFLQPERYADSAGWHVLQFERALANGGLFGRSWGKGVWSQSYLPLGYSDSIFATVAESVGLVGVLPFVLIVVAWVMYGCWRVRRTRDAFAAAAILGLVSLLGVQAFLHLGVNLGLVPPTGVTLPLISYGGSSLVSTMVCVGMVESLSRGDGAAAATTAGEAD